MNSTDGRVDRQSRLVNETPTPQWIEEARKKSEGEDLQKATNQFQSIRRAQYPYEKKIPTYVVTKFLGNFSQKAHTNIRIERFSTTSTNRD